MTKKITHKTCLWSFSRQPTKSWNDYIKIMEGKRI